MLSIDYVATTEENLFSLAKQIAPRLLPGAVIYLEGPLGVGKTTWVRGLLRALNYQDKVKSPTYTLIEPYHLSTYTVYHMDLYRLSHPEELDYLGIQDYFSGTSISLIEWAEKGKGYLPPCDWLINMTFQRSARHLQIQAHTPLGGAMLQAVSHGHQRLS